MDRLKKFFESYNYVLVFLALVVVSIIGISQKSYYQSSIIVSWGNGIAGPIYEKIYSINKYFNLAETNEQLVQENARLREQLENSYIKYDEKIFSINDTTYKQQYTYIEASIIKNSYNKQSNFIMINKGFKQGVHTDMAVMSPQGIVGIVVNTTANFSMIMSLLHPDSRNSVKIKRTNISGSLMWDGKDFRYGTIIDIPTTQKIYKNDTIITSGFSQEFPEGILVGFVENVTHDSGNGFYTVKMRFATDFNKLNFVYVINNHFAKEQEQLIEETEKKDEQTTDSE